MKEPLVRVEGLIKNFPLYGGILRRVVANVQAVSDVSFEIQKGETLGLVGESGCGKSTLGRCILRLIEPTAGKIFFKNQELTQLPLEAIRKLRRQIQIIFQDPYSALNPRLTVEDLVGEPLDIHKLYSTGGDRRKRIIKLLDLCGLRSESLSRYPHEFSGGQRQRICIARALAVEPEFIVCDEPISALDVSIQAQIINLLQDLQKELGLTYLFIAHDLKMVRQISDRVAVMYLGKIVEIAQTDEIFSRPLHPYTKSLLSSIPIQDPDSNRQKTVLIGDVPSPIHPPSGCHFHTRCPIAKPPRCMQERPEQRELVALHGVACHYAEQSLTV